MGAQVIRQSSAHDRQLPSSSVEDRSENAQKACIDTSVNGHSNHHNSTSNPLSPSNALDRTTLPSNALNSGNGAVSERGSAAAAKIADDDDGCNNRSDENGDSASVSSQLSPEEKKRKPRLGIHVFTKKEKQKKA